MGNQNKPCWFKAQTHVCFSIHQWFIGHNHEWFCDGICITPMSNKIWKNRRIPSPISFINPSMENKWETSFVLYKTHAGFEQIPIMDFTGLTS